MKDPHDTATVDFIGESTKLRRCAVCFDDESPCKDCDPRKLPDNFKDFPTILGDVRSDITGLGADWAPRDLLLTMLKELDAGKISADTLVIAWCYNDQNNVTQVCSRSASKDPMRAIAVWSIANNRRSS
jgi:hypothetical protein